MDDYNKLTKALEAGQLTHGAALQVEELDLSGIGMYTDEQKDELLKNGAKDDFFLKTIMGTTMWARESDEGVKWHIYNIKDLKPWKDIK